ncbi:MAG: SCO family protein [Candidatus Neomarinimicrobiota bacterium]|nr:SCO family protein [Candidatus Neomarinimicrobiota bacterium]
MNDLNKKLILSFLIVFFLGIVALFTLHEATESKIQNLNVVSSVSSFELTNFNDDIFTDNNLKDKITILSFVFTSCPDACPIMSENFSLLQKRFKDSDLIQFVSITVDPEYDSNDILNTFSEKYSNGNNWYFLRGDIDYISTLSEKGFFLSASLLPAGHSTRFVLIDKKKNIRKYYEGTDDAAIMELQNDIVFLINEKR